MLTLEGHPHAKAVLGAALTDEPAHAYLLHGPAGSGKRSTARAFAGELLARGAKDPQNVKTRVDHGAHPDLTWVAPSGAHEMLRRDVDEAVVAAAAHTPFEASYRIFVLERADTLIEQAANALLKRSRSRPPTWSCCSSPTSRHRCCRRSPAAVSRSGSTRRRPTNWPSDCSRTASRPRPRTPPRG